MKEGIKPGKFGARKCVRRGEKNILSKVMSLLKIKNNSAVDGL